MNWILEIFKKYSRSVKFVSPFGSDGHNRSNAHSLCPLYMSMITLPYKTLFPRYPVEQLTIPSFLFARACFARIYKEARGAVYQIRGIPITGAKPPKKIRQDKVI